jgi:hypothetical protein
VTPLVQILISVFLILIALEMQFKGSAMRSDPIRYLSWILFVAFANTALLPAKALHAQTQKIRISTSSRSNTTVAYYVAISKGFFREEGFDVELIQANPRLGAMALMNGDVAFTGSFVSTVRGILQGLPLKIVLVALPKGVYYLIARPEIKDIQDLKGKKLGVSTLRGSDHLVAEELLRAKGFNPSWLQPIGLGDTPVRTQAIAAGVVDVVALSPPHDLIAQTNGCESIGRAAGNRDAGIGDDHVGSTPQGEPANGEAGSASVTQGQPFQRRKSTGNYPRVVAVGETVTGDRRSLLRPRAQNDQERRANDGRRDGKFP